MAQSMNYFDFTKLVCEKIYEAGTREVSHVFEPDILPINAAIMVHDLHLLLSDIDAVKRKLAVELGVAELPSAAGLVLSRMNIYSPAFIPGYRIGDLSEDLYWRLVACRVVEPPEGSCA